MLIVKLSVTGQIIVDYFVILSPFLALFFQKLDKGVSQWKVFMMCAGVALFVVS